MDNQLASSTAASQAIPEACGEDQTASRNHQSAPVVALQPALPAQGAAVSLSGEEQTPNQTEAASEDSAPVASTASLSSALAAVFRQQQQQPAVGVTCTRSAASSMGAEVAVQLPAVAGSASAAAHGGTSAVLHGPRQTVLKHHEGPAATADAMMQEAGSGSSQQLPSPADFLQLLVGLVKDAAGPQVASSAAMAAAAAAAAAAPTTDRGATAGGAKRKASSSSLPSPAELSPAATHALLDNDLAAQLLRLQAQLDARGCFGVAGSTGGSGGSAGAFGALLPPPFPPTTAAAATDGLPATSAAPTTVLQRLSVPPASTGDAAPVSGHDSEGMDCELVSPSMAAAAAAMTGLAGLSADSPALFFNTNRGGSSSRLMSAGGSLRKAATKTAAATAAESKKVSRSRKVPRVNDEEQPGGASGSDVAGVPGAWWMHLQEQQQQPALEAGSALANAPDIDSAVAAAAGAAAAAAASAAMFAGSFGGQSWYDSSAWLLQAALPAFPAAAGVGMMPPALMWPHMTSPQQQQQQSSQPPKGSRATKAGATRVPKASLKRAPSQSDDTATFSTAAAGGGGSDLLMVAPDAPPRGSSAVAAAVAAAGAGDSGAGVTAAGKRGPRGGGGKSSTSNFRGVTQHRYTQRWEAHLWDPDAIRQKTAGSSRTRGRQTYLGGYSSETEAARAYDRAALVYWGSKGHTNFPKDDYAGELPLLSALKREEVVANLRGISHNAPKFVQTLPGVMPHQALPGMWEGRLYADQAAANTPYQYLGTYATQEAAAEAVSVARDQQEQQQQQPEGEPEMDVEPLSPTTGGLAATGRLPVPAAE